MFVPFSAADFLDRALAVYADRIGVVDEPDQPAPALGELTYARVGELARAQAARLDELGIGFGERVAYVSHNSARLLTAFFGVSGYGRVLVPINFRLSPDEVRYIVEHSGARVLLRRPRARGRARGRRVRAHVRASATTSEHVRSRAWSPSRGSTTRTPPPRSTTPPAPPRGPRACRSPTATSGPTR